MGQMNGAENSDGYTVVIFRGSTAKPLRFSFHRKLVSKLLIVGAIFVLVDILVILGIETPKIGDTANGRGGVDAPLPDGHTLPTSEKISKSEAGAQYVGSVEKNKGV